MVSIKRMYTLTVDNVRFTNMYKYVYSIDKFNEDTIGMTGYIQNKQTPTDKLRSAHTNTKTHTCIDINVIRTLSNFNLHICV